MNRTHLLYCLDYHHGQATRVVAGGIPHIPGKTMAEKQDFFEQHLDHVRKATILEPRGHRQMLGAVITAPSRPEAEVGLLFTHPAGYFAMCGDSMFSAVTAMVETGMLSVPGAGRRVMVDTPAGLVGVDVALSGEQVRDVTMENVASYPVTAARLEIGEYEAQVDVAYGGLYYGFVNARDMGIDSLREIDTGTLIEKGSVLWEKARDAVSFVDPVTGHRGTVDLVTLWENVDERVHRVANFYAPGTMGRTPSGTGLSARLALDASRGLLLPGQVMSHESPLGLRFKGEVRPEGSLFVPRITARSFLMGINMLNLGPEDPFQHGFRF